MITYCDVCEKMNETTQESVEREYAVKDIKVKATINIIICKACGSEVFDKENEIKNDIIVFDEYKKVKKLLTSKEISNIREKYGLSQVALARILGFGEKTITRYENGSIQDATHDNLLRLMKNESNFLMLWMLNKGKFKERENDKITNKIYHKVNPSFEYKVEESYQSKYETFNKGGIVCEW